MLTSCPPGNIPDKINVSYPALEQYIPAVYPDGPAPIIMTSNFVFFLSGIFGPSLLVSNTAAPASAAIIVSNLFISII